MPRDLLKRPIVKRACRCESCGIDFHCVIGLTGCWCSKIELTDDQRAGLAAKFANCLCQNCLNDIHAREQSATG